MHQFPGVHTVNVHLLLDGSFLGFLGVLPVGKVAYIHAMLGFFFRGFDLLANEVSKLVI